jgi:hypothetical protein
MRLSMAALEDLGRPEVGAELSVSLAHVGALRLYTTDPQSALCQRNRHHPALHADLLLQQHLLWPHMDSVWQSGEPQAVKRT